MPRYTDWIWSIPHGRHYMFLLDDDGHTKLKTIWAGPAAATPESAQPASTERVANTLTYRNQSHTLVPLRGQPYTATKSPKHQQTNVTPGSSGWPAGGGAVAYRSDEVPVEDKEKEEDENDWDGAESAIDDDDDDKVEELGTTGYGKGKGKRHDSAQISPTLLMHSMQNLTLGTVNTSTPSHQPYSSQQYPQQRPQHSKYPCQPSKAPQTSQTHVVNISGAQSSMQGSRQQSRGLTVASLDAEAQGQIKYLERRVIKTDPGTDDREMLDKRYRRVAVKHHSFFFVTGRVFKMLWTEPAGQDHNFGKTRNSTHFSTVWLGERAYSEIRHFVVVRNRGVFSQCIPIQTYRGNGASKAGLVMVDHGIIHTTPDPPNQLPGEHLTKYSIRVDSTDGEQLHAASRVNYGKAYVVEHNVKVLDIGMVTEKHRYLLAQYFDLAITGR